MAKAAAFNGQLKVFIDSNLSPEAQSAFLAREAKKKLNELIGSGRASNSFRRFVDGREGAAEESVGPAPNGQIVYQFNRLGAVCTFALSFLVNRSPSKSGAYRKSFYLGISTSGSLAPSATGPTRGARGRFVPSSSSGPAAGGKFIPMSAFNPDAITPNVTEIVIGNTQPYSRKIDVQLVGGQKLTFEVPAGLFDDAAAAIKSRFGAIVNVKRVYTMRFPGQYILKQEQFHKSGKRKGRARGRAGKPVESPAIIITPK